MKSGFLRYHGSVYKGLPFHQFPVGGDFYPRLDEDPVALDDLVDRYIMCAHIGYDLVSLGGHEPYGFIQVPGGTHHLLHLDPTSKEHDIDEG